MHPWSCPLVSTPCHNCELTLTSLSEYPDQSTLIKALEDRPDKSRYKEALEHMYNVAVAKGFDKTMADHDLDLIATPMDSAICSHSAASGRSTVHAL